MNIIGDKKEMGEEIEMEEVVGGDILELSIG